MTATDAETPALLLPTVTDPDAIRRDRWGRPMLTDPTGKTRALRRISSEGKVLDSEAALIVWHGEMVLRGVVLDPLIVTRALGVDGNTRELRKLADTAAQLGGSKAGATYGTTVHNLTALVERGVLSWEDIPDDDMRHDVFAYLMELGRWGLSAVGVEFFVADFEAGRAGTCDRLYRRQSDGALVVGDLKTSGGKGEYLYASTACQLAAYRDAVPAKIDGTLIGWPDEVRADVGLLVHIPRRSGTCTITPLDLDRGREGLTLSAAVQAWRKTGDAFVKTRP